MLLEPGSKLLVAHRRLYGTDHTRYFVGVVDAYEAGVARVTGTSWTRDPYSGELTLKGDARTKLISLAAGTLIAYVLPPDCDLSRLTIEVDPRKNVFLTDGAELRMDLTERQLYR